MKTKDFIRRYDACLDGARWALSISKDMGDVWEAMLSQEKWGWLIWTLSRPGVFPESVQRKMACKFIRETPLADGRVVWDLLTDERSRKAVEVAESYADGKATDEELDSAYAAAAAYDAAAWAAARSAADAADAAWAAYAAARDAAAYATDRNAACAAHAAGNAAVYAACAAHAADAANAAAKAAYAHAKAAQIKMIAEIGNPFRKGQGDE